MASARDEAALQLIDATRSKRLINMRERAEKWIAGLTALVTVLATAMLVKGPESFTDVPDSLRYVVLGLLVLGGVGVGVGLVAAYSAAFGGVFSSGAIDTMLAQSQVVDGAASRLETAATSDTTAARNSLRLALGATVLGALLLAGAVVVSWTTPPGSGSPVCVKVGDESIQFKSQPEVVSGTVTYVKC